jgi:hypothetical protein
MTYDLRSKSSGIKGIYSHRTSIAYQAEESNHKSLRANFSKPGAKPGAKPVVYVGDEGIYKYTMPKAKSNITSDSERNIIFYSPSHK